MRKRWIDSLIPFIFVFLTFFSFRTYFFQNTVPLPFNLLVFYYSPWKYETGYGLRIPNKPLGYDNVKLFYPLRKFTIDQMRSGRIPLWNPFVFSGNVHLATYQSSVLYPLNIFYFILPTMDAWTVLILLQPILSGWFTYLFLRSLTLSRNASFFGALGFAFSGWMIAMWEEVLVLVHSFLWLPLALYASNLLWEKKFQRRGILLLILALTMSVLAGFLQMSIYVFSAILLWNVYRWFTYKDNIHRNKIAFHVGVCIVLSTFLSAIQWVPALEAYVLSARGTTDAANLFQMFLSPLSHLITFIVSDFWGNPGSYNYFSKIRYIQERTIYIGIFVLIFALFAFFKRTKGDHLFWKIFTVVTLSLGFALPTSWIWYTFRVPILSVAQPARIFALSTFGMCVLAGYGIDKWQKYHGWKEVKRILVFVFLVIFLLFFFTLSMRFISGQPQLLSLCHCDPKQVIAYATISFRNLILPGISTIFVFISFVFFRKRPIIFYSFVYLVTIFGGFYYANKILYFSERQFEFPSVAPIVKLKELSGLNRVWTYGEAHVMRNILSYYGIYSPEGYDALFLERYGELINTIKSGGTATSQINRTDVDFSEVGPFEPMTKNQYRLRVMSLLGVKYILALKSAAGSTTTEQEQFPSSLFSLVWSNENWRIWEYRQALPRAFFVSNYIIEEDPQKIADYLFNPLFQIQNTLILESQPKEFESVINSASGEVVIARYEPQTVDVSVSAKQNGFLFLSDTYYPGWKALVDGRKTNIYRADYAFRAVPVSAGNHTVRFVYDPISFKIGLGTSAIAFVVALLFILKLFRESQ